MKKHIVFILNAIGWLMLVFAMLLAGIRDIALDPQLYFDLQMKADILDEAGISESDLLQLDAGLARYLGGSQDNLDYQIQVFGRLQPAFNQRELTHMQDCRRLFAPVVSLWLNIVLAAAGVVLVLYGGMQKSAWKAAWLASAVFILPIGLLAAWAAVDFSAAFTFFHELLFTNDLWLLDPRTDLLIRICPQSMFMNMGLRIAVRSALVLLGLPLVLTLLHILDKRKRKQA